MKVTYASNGGTVGDGMRITKVSEGGTKFEVLVDEKTGRFSPLALVGDTAAPVDPVEPGPEPVEPPVEGYPSMPEGMRKPSDYAPMSGNWSAGDYVLTTWAGGAGTMGNPALADFRDNGSVILSARMIGSTWHSGVMQFWKQTRGKGRWSAILSSDNPQAVCAFFTYADNGAELDIEHVKRNGTTGFQLNVHMPKEGGGMCVAKSLPFVEWTAEQFKVPTLFEIEHSETSCRFFIGGKLVGEIKPSDMQTGAKWLTDAKMATFLSVEKHGGWAGPWPYDNASMQVYGVKLPA